jgi:hypothetical protein
MHNYFLNISNADYQKSGLLNRYTNADRRLAKYLYCRFLTFNFITSSFNKWNSAQVCASSNSIKKSWNKNPIKP